MNKHSPTPWKIKGPATFKSERIGIDGIDIATVWTKDATFIVHAVNCHEELLKVAKALHRDKWWGRPQEEHDALCNPEIDKAIAKAEGTH